MFRVEFFVDDKRLAQALTNLTGLAIDLKVHPVVNAVKTKNSLTTKTSGDIVEMFAQHLKEKKVESFKAPFVQDFVQQHGYSKTAYSWLLTKAFQTKLITKIGKSTSLTYKVRA